ncbi:hypothetical protein IID24_04965 [Patescibacteria group bacterium]|nr:hypothetical protein [Patescibacteria group bacterium]
MQKDDSQVEYLSLQRASELCSYSQEYLSLRARQGKLKAVKIDNRWFTTRIWLQEYIQGLERIEVIQEAELFPGEELTGSPASLREALRAGFSIGLISLLIFAGVAFGKDAWYQLGRELAENVQDLGEGFDNGALKLTRTFATGVEQFAEGFDSGSVKQVRQVSLVANSFGNGFAYGVSSPAAVSDFVGEYIEWLKQGIVSFPRNIVQEYKSFDTAVQQGLTSDLNLIKDSLARLRQTGQNLTLKVREAGNTVVKGYTSLNKAAQQVVESVTDPIGNAILSGVNLVFSPRAAPPVSKLVLPNGKIAADLKELSQELEEIKTLGGISGPAGPRGLEGPRGLQGPPGSPGPQGVSGSSIITATTQYVSGPTVTTTAYFQGSNVFQGAGSFESLGVSSVLSSRDFSTKNAILGGSSSDKLTVNAVSTFLSPATFVSSITFSNTLTSAGQGVFTKASTLAHTGTWAIDSVTWNQADATLYINPASATADSNLLGLAVNGNVKFTVDAEGDIFGNNLILTGSTTSGTTTIAGDLIVEGNTTLGDAGSDTLIVYPNTLVFQEATTISTITGALTIDGDDGLTLKTSGTGNISITAVAGADVLIGDDATILFVDGGTGGVGIGIPESDINYGNGHSSPPISNSVKDIASQHRNLIKSLSIICSATGNDVRGPYLLTLPFVRVHHFFVGRQTPWIDFPQCIYSHNERKGFDTIQEGRVLSINRNTIEPLRSVQQLKAVAKYRIRISRINWQILFLYYNSLARSAVNGLLRQKIKWARYGIWCIRFIRKRDTILRWSQLGRC